MEKGVVVVGLWIEDNVKNASAGVLFCPHSIHRATHGPPWAERCEPDLWIDRGLATGMPAVVPRLSPRARDIRQTAAWRGGTQVGRLTGTAVRTVGLRRSVGVMRCA